MRVDLIGTITEHGKHVVGVRPITGLDVMVTEVYRGLAWCGSVNDDKTAILVQLSSVQFYVRVEDPNRLIAANESVVVGVEVPQGLTLSAATALWVKAYDVTGRFIEDHDRRVCIITT